MRVLHSQLGAQIGLSTSVQACIPPPPSRAVAQAVLKATDGPSGAAALLCFATMLSAAAGRPGAGSQGLLARVAPGTTEQLVQRLLSIMHAVSGDVRQASAAAAAAAAVLSLAVPAASPPAGPLSPRLAAVAATAAQAAPLAASLQPPPAPPQRLLELAALVPDGILQQLRRLLLWQQPAGVGAPPLPAMAEFEGFPGITGMLDGSAYLAAMLSHAQPSRVLQSGVGLAVARLLLAAAARGDGASWSELSPAGLLALLQALQRLLQQDANAVALLQQQPQLVSALLALVQPAALEAASRFVDATSACNPHNSLGTSGSLTPLNDGPTAANGLLAAVVGALYAPFLQPAQSPQHDAALAGLQQAVSAQAELPGILVAAIAAAPGGSDELGAAVGLLARLVLSSERLMALYVQAGGMAPSLVEK